MVESRSAPDNESLSLIPEAVMLAIFLLGALGGAMLIYRTVGGIVHAIPDASDDLIFV